MQDKGSLRPNMDKLGALQELEAHQASHDATDQHALCTEITDIYSIASGFV